jgi:hypothetical protein
MGADPSLLPEPWEEFQPLFRQLDEHGANKVELSRSWVIALQDQLGPLLLAPMGLSISSIGTWVISGGTPTITTKVGSAIVILFGFLVWLGANFSAADALWDIVIAPYMRSRRQIHALYRGHSNVLIRLTLVCVASSMGYLLCLLVYTHPFVLGTAAFLVGVFVPFFSRVQRSEEESTALGALRWTS